MDQIETSTISFDNYQPLGLWEYIQIAIFATLGLMTIIFNFFLFAILKRGKDIFDDVTVLLFRSLATTDIVTGLLVSILEGIVFLFRDFPYSHTACMYMPIFCCCMILSTSIHVCLMNLQRFIAVSYPFLYLRIATVKHTRVALIITKFFVVCISLMFLPIHNFPMTAFTQGLCESRSFFIVVNDLNALPTSSLVSLIILTVVAAVPVIVLTYTNIRLLILANKKRKGRPGKTGNQLRTEINTGNCKVCQSLRRLPKGLRTIIIITFLYYFSVLPFMFAVGMLVIQPAWSETVFDAIYFMSMCMILGSCWWNVPVYVLTSVTFRKRALSILRKVCHIQYTGGTRSPSVTTSTVAHDMTNEPSKQTIES